MPRHSFDTDADGIELSADTLIYSYFPDAATPQEALARAFLHEKSYPRVGFFPIFFPRMGGPHHHRPLLSRAFLATSRVLLFVVGRVRFLVKPQCFLLNRLLA